MSTSSDSSDGTTKFDPSLFAEGALLLGNGELGGKAQGLLFFNAMLDAEFDRDRFPGVDVAVPPFAVITTEFYDRFLNLNELRHLPVDSLSDDEIAARFQAGSVPDELAVQLRGLVQAVDGPLAVRSSSLLEDAILSPFAGVYQTKMVPNNEPDPECRLGSLVEAVTFVYASSHQKLARDYLKAAGKTLGDEKMAIVIQEIVGTRHGERFYPVLSGVARSYDFYPCVGSRPEDGVVSLALGLGKTIVDGDYCWTYSPTRPEAPPPYGAIGDLLKQSQRRFWAVNLGSGDENTASETEHLVRGDLTDAETDGSLRHVASTYVPESDRIVTGIGRKGPRLVNFARLLGPGAVPFNETIRELLAIAERAAGSEVEIEFALSIPPGGQPRLGLVQVRPMFVSHEVVNLDQKALAGDDLLLVSHHVMGNGTIDDIRDIVYVKPETFDTMKTRQMASEIETLNATLTDAERPYMLIGFGRWGSADPFLGVPVAWGSISGARLIVESTRPDFTADASQGSHFLHNVAAGGVGYLSVRHSADPGLDWAWLNAQPARSETEFVRHVRLASPLLVKLDGRANVAAVWRPDSFAQPVADYGMVP